MGTQTRRAAPEFVVLARSPERDGRAMTVYCCMCRNLMPERRANRGSHFCSETCHEQYRRQRRSWRALKNCRLCGRPARQRSLTGARPTEHSISEKGRAEENERLAIVLE